MPIFRITVTDDRGEVVEGDGTGVEASFVVVGYRDIRFTGRPRQHRCGPLLRVGVGPGRGPRPEWGT